MSDETTQNNGADEPKHIAHGRCVYRKDPRPPTPEMPAYYPFLWVDEVLGESAERIAEELAGMFNAFELSRAVNNDK